METKLPNGMELTPYLATAYAERFGEGEDSSVKEQLCAWSYLICTKIAFSLQGWFGRFATSLIERDLISEDGIVNWDLAFTTLNVDP